MDEDFKMMLGIENEEVEKAVRQGAFLESAGESKGQVTGHMADLMVAIIKHWASNERGEPNDLKLYEVCGLPVREEHDGTITNRGRRARRAR